MGKKRPTVRIPGVWPKSVDYRWAMAHIGELQWRQLKVIAALAAVAVALLAAGLATVLLGLRMGWW